MRKEALIIGFLLILLIVPLNVLSARTVENQEVQLSLDLRDLEFTDGFNSREGYILDMEEFEGDLYALVKTFKHVTTTYIKTPKYSFLKKVGGEWETLIEDIDPVISSREPKMKNIGGELLIYGKEIRVFDGFSLSVEFEGLPPVLPSSQGSCRKESGNPNWECVDNPQPNYFLELVSHEPTLTYGVTRGGEIYRRVYLDGTASGDWELVYDSPKNDIVLCAALGKCEGGAGFAKKYSFSGIESFEGNLYLSGGDVETSSRTGDTPGEKQGEVYLFDGTEITSILSKKYRSITSVFAFNGGLYASVGPYTGPFAYGNPFLARYDGVDWEDVEWPDADGDLEEVQESPGDIQIFGGNLYIAETRGRLKWPGLSWIDEGNDPSKSVDIIEYNRFENMRTDKPLDFFGVIENGFLNSIKPFENNLYVAYYNKTQVGSSGGKHGGIIFEFPLTSCDISQEIIILLEAEGDLPGSPLEDSYPFDVCSTNLECTIKSGSCDSLAGEQCTAELSSITDANLAECGSGYDFNLCCIPSEVTSCTPQVTEKFCADKGYQCGVWDGYDPDTVTGCPGVTHDCDNIVGGGCSGGTVCQLSNGQCSSEPRFWSTLDDLTEAIDEINILIEGGDVLMNLKDQGILADGQIEFSITNDGNEVRTILSDEVSNPNLVSVPWSISQSDLVDSDLEEEFFFRVEGGTSLPLKINVLTQCFEVSFCSDYKSQPDCDSDQVLCTVGEIGVENNNPSVNCWDDSGGYNYNCGCKWNEDPQQGINKCGPKYFRVDHDPERPGYDPSWEGSCTFSETTTDTCDDEFLSYSWSGAWDDGNSSFTSDPGDVNFREDPATGDWYYDPLTSKGILSESQFCEQSVGEKVVPCPSQIKLPFFGFWQIFSSLSLIAFIYVVMVFRKN